MHNQKPLGDDPKPGSLWKWAAVIGGLWVAYSLGQSDGRNSVSSSALYAASDSVEMPAEVVADAPSTLPSFEPVTDEIADAATSQAPASDADFAQLYAGWKQLDDQDTTEATANEAQRAALRAAQAAEQASQDTRTDPYSHPSNSQSFAYAAPVSQASSETVPRVGCAENGSCYGEISEATGRPKTVYVGGYYRRDGTYVRGHYRSKGR